MSNAQELAATLRHLRNVGPDAVPPGELRAVLLAAAEELETLAVDADDAERMRWLCLSDWFVGPPVGPDHNINRHSLARAIDRAKLKGDPPCR